MSTSFYWRDHPRTKPRRKGLYLVTIVIDDGYGVTLVNWDGIAWERYQDVITAWMPCPLRYKEIHELAAKA